MKCQSCGTNDKKHNVYCTINNDLFGHEKNIRVEKTKKVKMRTILNEIEKSECFKKLIQEENNNSHAFFIIKDEIKLIDSNSKKILLEIPTPLKKIIVRNKYLKKLPQYIGKKINKHINGNIKLILEDW